ncbi:MAG TPA: metallophosphoesterase [Vicinamibacterales bacterium]|nr:metallophosphoesterase [Vicinamibacterales bacterium]
MPSALLRYCAVAAVVASCLSCATGPSASRVAGNAVQVAAPPVAAAPVSLPNRDGSLKFVVFGDFGTGERGQYELANQMAVLHQTFPFEMVATAGDNIYGSDRPQDFQRKFETPYKPLLDAGVKFYASLGNHDSREQRYYKLFNMDGKLYYSFKAPEQDVRFIALESTYLVPEQIEWLEETLKSAKEDWKIVYCHHPLYSSGGRHGSDLTLRAALEPLFIKYGVSVVFGGHDHIYERMKPQGGIQYFLTGSGGALRKGDYRRGQPFSERIVADQQVFLAAEIFKDEMVFNAISRTGEVVDSGVIARRQGD